MEQKLLSKGLQNRYSFSKGNNEGLVFVLLVFFKRIVLDEAQIEGPHPQKHKNDVEFFQLLPYNPKVHHQSDTSVDRQGKEDVVMHLAHAQQTQSTSVPVKLSVRSFKKTCWS